MSSVTSLAEEAARLFSTNLDKDEKGVVTNYGLAYIDFARWPKDNGRVLWYDNGHGIHERHYKGEVEQVDFTTYAGTGEEILFGKWKRLGGKMYKVVFELDGLEGFRARVLDHASALDRGKTLPSETTVSFESPQEMFRSSIAQAPRTT